MSIGQSPLWCQNLKVFLLHVYIISDLEQRKVNVLSATIIDGFQCLLF